MAERLTEDNKRVGILYISYNSVAARYNIEENSLNFRISISEQQIKGYTLQETVSGSHFSLKHWRERRG